MSIKRSSAETGQRIQLTTYQPPVLQTANVKVQQSQQPQSQNQPIISTSSVVENFALTAYPEDAGYFSPSLQDEVFQQVATGSESVLLHTSHLDALRVNSILYIFSLFTFYSKIICFKGLLFK